MESHFNWHDSIVQLQDRPIDLCTTERTPDSILPAECSPPPSLTSVHHEKCKQLRCVTAKMSDTRWPQTKQPDARSPSFQNDISTDTSQRQAAKHWTSGTQQAIAPTLQARGRRVGCQRWDVCLHTEVRFPLYLSCHHSSQYQNLRCKTQQNRILRIFRVAANPPGSKWTEKQMWDLGLDSRIGTSSNTFAPSQCSTLNIWLEHLAETTRKS